MLRSSWWSAGSLAVALVSTVVGCGGAAEESARARLAEEPSPAAAVLKESLYSKSPQGGLSEEQLQQILGSPIDLQFPARVGVVALTTPFDPEGVAPLRVRSAAAGELAHSLRGARQFSHVSDVSTELPHVGGIEGLRVLAARYRLRYLVLYSERFEDATHANGWAWLYPTLIGVFLAPAITVESFGIAQADLVDVRSGTVLYSLMEPIHVESEQLALHSAQAHREKQGEAAARAARQLAKRVAQQADVLVAYAEDFEHSGYQARTRILPAPIAPDDVTRARVAKMAAPPAPTAETATTSNP
jgi:hypothetical protein